MGIYFKFTYGMQFVAAVNVIVALFLKWHERAGSAAALIGSIFSDFVFPWSFLSPWTVLLFLPPVALYSVIRGGMGIFDKDIGGWNTAFVLSGLAFLSMFWFFINFADPNNASQLGTDVSEVGVGYWLTVTSFLLLVAFIGIEKMLPKQDLQLAYYNNLPLDSAERIWQGWYRSCPHCGSANNPDAKRCDFCGIMLFPDE